MDDRLRAQQLSAELNMPLAEAWRFDSIPSEVLGLLPEATLAALRVVPLAEEDGFVVLACAEPEHFRYMKELARYLKRPVRPMLAARRDIARTLRLLFQVEVPPGWLPAESLDLPPPAAATAEPQAVTPPHDAAAPAETSPDEGDDATIPMTAQDVQRVLAEYAAQMAAKPGGAAAAAPAAGEAAAATAQPTDWVPPGSSAPAPPTPSYVCPAAPAPWPAPSASAPAGSGERTVALGERGLAAGEARVQPGRGQGAPPAVGASLLQFHGPNVAARVERLQVAPFETAKIPPQQRQARLVPSVNVQAAPARSKIGGRFEDRYQLIRKIATGGMAEVYLARVIGAEGFQREVVVKKILPCYTEDPTFIEMFIDEAKIACRLNHPNIAQVYELAIEEGEYLMAMEFIEGRDLLTLMDHARRKGTRIPPEVTAYIIASVLEGLEHAHGKRDDRGQLLGIIHRDITPSNILISYDGHVKIIDFGIAKAREKLNVTRVGYMKGKPGYLAPEQAKGEPLDQRVDVFAAGILLYELLSNKRLFPDSARASVMASLINFDINPLIRFNFRIPWSLRGVIRRSLALAPKDRFASAMQMAEPLHTFMRRKARRDPRMELHSLLLRTFPPATGKEGPSR